MRLYTTSAAAAVQASNLLMPNCCESSRSLAMYCVQFCTLQLREPFRHTSANHKPEIIIHNRTTTSQSLSLQTRDDLNCNYTNTHQHFAPGASVMQGGGFVIFTHALFTMHTMLLISSFATHRPCRRRRRASRRCSATTIAFTAATGFGPHELLLIASFPLVHAYILAYSNRPHLVRFVTHLLSGTAFASLISPHRNKCLIAYSSGHFALTIHSQVEIQRLIRHTPAPLPRLQFCDSSVSKPHVGVRASECAAAATINSDMDSAPLNDLDGNGSCKSTAPALAPPSVSSAALANVVAPTPSPIHSSVATSPSVTSLSSSKKSKSSSSALTAAKSKPPPFGASQDEFLLLPNSRHVLLLALVSTHCTARHTFSFVLIVVLQSS